MNNVDYVKVFELLDQMEACLLRIQAIKKAWEGQ